MNKLILNPMLSHKNGATEIYLIRHADALPGQETVIPGGGYDAQPLSELGQRQAQALARWLEPIKFQAVYSSPLRRTQETAAPVAAAQNLPVQLEDDLREVRLNIDLDGFMEGPTDAASTARALRERLAEVMRLIGEGGQWSKIPGSEGSEAVRKRAVEVVTGLAGRHPGGRLAVVSHGGMINAYLAELLSIERDLFFPIHNTAISVIRCLGQEASLVSLNQIPHLRVAQVETED